MHTTGMSVDLKIFFEMPDARMHTVWDVGYWKTKRISRLHMGTL